jgi:hypothetical protein
VPGAAGGPARRAWRKEHARDVLEATQSNKWFAAQLCERGSEAVEGPDEGECVCTEGLPQQGHADSRLAPLPCAPMPPPLVLFLSSLPLCLCRVPFAFALAFVRSSSLADSPTTAGGKQGKKGKEGRGTGGGQRSGVPCSPCLPCLSLCPSCPVCLPLRADWAEQTRHRHQEQRESETRRNTTHRNNDSEGTHTNTQQWVHVCDRHGVRGAAVCSEGCRKKSGSSESAAPAFAESTCDCLAQRELEWAMRMGRWQGPLAPSAASLPLLVVPALASPSQAACEREPLCLSIIVMVTHFSHDFSRLCVPQLTVSVLAFRPSLPRPSPPFPPHSLSLPDLGLSAIRATIVRWQGQPYEGRGALLPVVFPRFHGGRHPSHR